MSSFYILHHFVFFSSFYGLLFLIISYWLGGLMQQAAIAMVPEGQLAAESALAVGAGGLNLGWFGHALWMLGYAAVFLYVAVKKWLSVSD